MNSKEIGNLTELQCMTGLYEIGCNISIPYGNSQKYDLIVDYNNKLYKVQIKHANNHNDEYLTFKTNWQGHNMKGYIAVPYTDSDIDFFATWYKGETYLIPILLITKLLMIYLFKLSRALLSPLLGTMVLVNPPSRN